MTTESWEKEFLPTPARKHITTPETRTPKKILAAARHSLAKWLGTRRDDLRRHGVSIDDLHEEGMLYSDDCALCQVSIGDGGVPDCTVCPLFKVRGGQECLTKNSYGEAIDGKPAKLIRELRRAVKLAEADVEAGKKKKKRR